MTRVHILLKSAEGWSIARIAKVYRVSQATVSNVRKRYREADSAGVVKDKVQQKRRRALNGADEAVLVAIACSPVPEGHDHWTLRMLRDKLIEWEVVEGISAATIHDKLKKMKLSNGNVSNGAFRRK